MSLFFPQKENALEHHINFVKKVSSSLQQRLLSIEKGMQKAEVIGTTIKTRDGINSVPCCILNHRG